MKHFLEAKENFLADDCDAVVVAPSCLVRVPLGKPIPLSFDGKFILACLHACDTNRHHLVSQVTPEERAIDSLVLLLLNAITRSDSQESPLLYEIDRREF